VSLFNPCCREAPHAWQAVCWRNADSSIWQPQDAHCASCEPLCLGSSTLSANNASVDEQPFCTGLGTDMHMTGFALYPTDCIILLFQEWKLDTPASFTGGIVAVFALGVLTELLTWLRRTKLASSRTLRVRPAAFRLAMTGAFAVQVTLGYLVMLAAMTYQGEIFIAVIVGLSVGHFCFNVRAPVAESVDACCVEPVSTDTTSRQSRQRRDLIAVAGEHTLASSTPRELPDPAASSVSLAASGTAEPHALAEVALVETQTQHENILELRVRPVTCQECVHTIVGALVEVDGVQQVHVGGDGIARITWSGAAESAQAFARRAISAIESTGKAAKQV
jgi:copper chaperone CopZ